MQQFTRDQFEALAMAQPAPAPMMKIDYEADLTEWTDDEEIASATGLFTVAWEQEPEGADSVGRFRPYADLCGLILIGQDGAEELLTRREACDRLTSRVIAAIEAEQSDAIDD